jgi:hypothetical protein
MTKQSQYKYAFKVERERQTGIATSQIAPIGAAPRDDNI